LARDLSTRCCPHCKLYDTKITKYGLLGRKDVCVSCGKKWK